MERITMSIDETPARGFDQLIHDRTRAERGVRHSQLNLVTVKIGDCHFTPGSHRHAGHMHLNPRS